MRHNFLNIYQNILMLGLKTIVLIQGFLLKKNFAVPLNQFSQLLKMMKIHTFLTLDSLYNLPE